MKKFAYALNESTLDLFFPHERIKTKVQILTILLEATRFLLYNEPDSLVSDSKLILHVKKMSRLFFITKNKYYSINFPFTFIIHDDITFINYRSIIDLDSKTISDLMSILKDDRFNSLVCLDFAEPVFELEPDYNDNLWILLKDLLMMEDGYLRFDKDTDGYLNAKADGKEHTHPENHIDIFYSNNNTFKVGLEKTIIHETFLDYIDSQTDCMYLKKFR
ncbi:hypothetical protein [Pedobacter heparinus]|uniref:Uncharacterized protein n=1 Tax=Pedobacter heparinus (strain ATCC 13125 / DSM 2366 / CIP 104194 / JCM 7457 / NBRC 12017 / NCIMB 9290 / NRRL B-14731 / HIM 762-3) TaxID=485917 RepID=C6XWR4_PEDHD|nr:hypothetical protein [Pedobacter heparinus]ACU04208.1 hypothetical protein Phep_2002 [Pedobacter heparinus DSM 2366]